MTINPCEQCGSRTFVALGVLGSLRHFRCRDCGWDTSVPLTEPADLDWEYDESGVRISPPSTFNIITQGGD